MVSLLRTVLIVLCCSVFLCACKTSKSSFSNSSSDSSSSSSFDFHPLVTENFDAVLVSGIAAKGIMMNAQVVIYSVDSAGQKSLVLGLGKTNTQGEYQIEIPAIYQGTLIVEVSGGEANVQAQMVCDSVKGCGEASADLAPFDTNNNQQIDFGETFPLDFYFVLTAVSEAVATKEPITLHVTPLTHLAAALAEKTANGFTRSSILQANSQVANLFGLMGDIRTLKPLDLSRSEVFASATENQLRYSLFASSFASLVTHRNELSGLLTNVTSEFVRQNGQLLLVNDSMFGIGFDKWLTASIELSEYLATKNTGWTRLGLQLRRQLAALRQVAGSTVFTNAHASEAIELDAMTQAKILVDDLSQWRDSLNFNDDSGIAFNQELSGMNDVLNNAKVAAAFMAAAKYTPVLVALPLISSNEQAVDYVCGKITGFAGVMCREFLANNALATLDCEGASKAMCSMMSSYLVIKVPTLEKGIKAEYSVLHQSLRVRGVLYEQQLDLTFTLNEFNLEGAIMISGVGTIDNADARFFVDGKVGLRNQEGDTSYQGVSELAIVVNNVDGSTYSVAQHFGDDDLSAIGFQISAENGDLAEVSVMTQQLEGGASSQSITIAFDDKSILIAQDEVNSKLITFSNQDGVSGTINLAIEGDAGVGAMMLNSVKLADILRERDELYVLFSDGERKNLTDLIM
jgi:hypothetical protein